MSQIVKFTFLINFYFGSCPDVEFDLISNPNTRAHDSTRFFHFAFDLEKSIQIKSMNK
ncbi:hypothetical protein METBIDRAFT_105094 [Metschnikowia bicuspidata var. bicuspidata NRRL YB-4993]|uniref:Uncharacterized protein n=1 Tax=Metschnikowia bicuspidata var. bicuspidata NRRL YB-4993 TaxID=869754 RepID=A0A1A0HHD3_9ASCO|nr:hypothetical protein METBIDRAFT_105094 [Metschnikowia bicuspidata var. bicuspidata NRRL YB-4993]OBA23411.1 hypothetical protein METBIDRAFT_105094 [Metschnikowia bicuspidata var. bicuspidata NRRL YB-4993]